MAFDDLPRIGTTSYGDGADRYDFNSSTLTTEFSVTPVRDEAQTTVTASRVRLTLRSFEEGRNIGRQIRRAIATLQKDGLPLRYRGRPFGDFDVNTGATGLKDVEFGPRVVDLRCKPHGTRSVEITWTVEFISPLCEDAAFVFKLRELNFKVEFDVAPNGDTTRTYSGYLAVPQNRLPTGGRLVLDSADAYRELVTPPLVRGFRRTARSFSLSPDFRRLDFRFTDQEMNGSAPPPGVVLCSASHEYAGEKLGVNWTGQLDAEYELIRGGNPGAAIIPFLALMADRTAAIRTVPAGTGIDGAALKPPGQPYPLRFTVGEPALYGPGNTRVKLGVTYLWAGVGLPAILAAGGLWRPTPDRGGWTVWAASVSTALGPRGTAGIRLNANETAIVDLCGKNPPVVPAAPPPRPPTAPPPRPVG